MPPCILIGGIGIHHDAGMQRRGPFPLSSVNSLTNAASARKGVRRSPVFFHCLERIGAMLEPVFFVG